MLPIKQQRRCWLSDAAKRRGPKPKRERAMATQIVIRTLVMAALHAASGAGLM